MAISETYTRTIPLLVVRKYHFESAHFLPKVRDGHKCKRMHGHNYEMEVAIEGEIAENGFLLDFWDLDEIVKPIVDTVDHRTLNDIEGLENPTAELIAVWFLRKIQKEFEQTNIDNLSVAFVKIYETEDCWAVAHG